MKEKPWWYGLKIGVVTYLIILVVAFVVGGPRQGGDIMNGLVFYLTLYFGWCIVPILWFGIAIYEKCKKPKDIGSGLK